MKSCFELEVEKIIGMKHFVELFELNKKLLSLIRRASEMTLFASLINGFHLFNDS